MSLISGDFIFITLNIPRFETPIIFPRRRNANPLLSESEIANVEQQETQ
ncbi:hypothetical protein P872_21850 [Rhodonellum psychrophilum GCM71 = DSM 17998]|uniref:Uncharacterized protein n=1 Tax=Rhodonellum psychrophilum GCM71 = DSM 17998 TaxID=1123057 RepID=U5BV15_9BACT|nr:hypothetical protein P872_21850 [Rhodonellum psychrophilum GCM71 = DSM 17998]